MKIGTKSLLFGVHQFLLHPLSVARAWRALYGRWPVREEWLAIFFHDTGYWGCPNIDGEEGRKHPLPGACRARDWAFRLGWDAANAFRLSLGHSREYAKLFGVPLSPLCWADKYCVNFESKWLVLFRGTLTGEFKEFRQRAIDSGHLPADATYRDWQRWYYEKVNAMPEIRRLLVLEHSNKVLV